MSERGRERDCAIAERVMGWRREDHTGYENGFVWWDDNNHRRWPAPSSMSAEFRPSDRIADAWEVVEHLRRQGWIVRVQEMPDGLPFMAGAGLRPEESQRINRRAVCMLYPNPCLDPALRGGRGPCEFGDTAPEAICRAALAALAAGERGG